MAASPGTHFEQPLSFDFDEESEAEITKILKRYPPERKASAVIPLLWVVQKQMGRRTHSAWVPVKGMDAIAERLEIPSIRVYEVCTFYLMFNTRPIGRYHLQLCTTTPCWLRGSDDIVAACRAETGIKGWGETSADGLFTMTEVECVGACVNAPILQVDDDFYEDMTPATVKTLIASLRAGERPPVGSMAGRQKSAPEGGPITLTTLSFAPEA